MLSVRGAAALALLSLISSTLSQDVNPNCINEAKWTKCQGASDFDCTTIKVAYDWENYDKNDPNRKEIPLRLIRAPATNVEPNKAKSIIMNPGGPGGSGIDSVLKGASGMIAQSGGVYNIIGFDPRGTALNMPYSCSETPSGPNAPQYPGSIYPASSSTDEKATYFDENFKYYEAVAKQCAVEQPDLGRIVSTIQTAQDVYAIAQAVGLPGDKMIRYWGYSYGTLLGNVIARLYPDLIDRMVLDGNIDPNSYYFDPSYVEASDVKRGTEHFFQMCAEANDGNCPWTALNLPQGSTTADKAANMLKKYNDWIGNDPLAPRRGRTSSITDDDSFKIRDLMHDTLKTNGFKTAAQTLEDWYTGKTKIGVKSKRQSEGDSFNPNDASQAEKDKVKNALGAIRCVDNELRPSDLSGKNYETWLNKFAEINPYSPEISSSYIFSCAPWTLQPTQNWGGVRWGGFKTNTSILFLQTYYDSVTPQQSAENAKGYYSNALIAYTNGIGHCTDTNPSDELNKALVAYWTNATPPSKKEYAVDVQNAFDRDINAGAPVSTQEPSETLPDQPKSTNTKRSLAYLFEDSMNGVKDLLVSRSGFFEKRANAPVKVVIKDNAYCRGGQSSTTSTTSTVSTTSSQTVSTTTTQTVSTTTTQTVSTTTTQTISTTSATQSSSTSSQTSSTTSGTISTSTSQSLTTPMSDTTTSTSSATTSQTITTSSTSTSSSTGSMESTTSTVQTSTLSTSTGQSSSTTITSTLTGSSSTGSTSTHPSNSVSTMTTATTATGASTTTTRSVPTSSTSSGTSYITTSIYGTSSVSTVTTLTSSQYRTDTWTTSTTTQSGNDMATWQTWTSSKSVTSDPSSWSVWDPARSKTTSRPTTQSWGSWTSKDDPSSWEAWTSQQGSVPVTKAVCAIGAKSCSTVIVAVPTQTVYVDYFVDVCPTGITTRTATITATCEKGCSSRPTGVPSGYTTKNVFCTACATPSTVIVTVVASSSAQDNKLSTWANVATSSTMKKTDPSSTWVQWSSATGSAPVNSVKPTTATNGNGADWNNWSGTSAGTKTTAQASSGAWTDSTATGPKVAKYTGAASRGMADYSLLLSAIFVGLWFL